ncbi:ABC transporter substrate-binding protein [Tranquillimonas alkanivorans]|uniref:Peptide/nickel transport system substrate-binding protein n=1 Tax=Tranquillimonas alkanivorans TaxID=441119 RepID=A0A1I5N8L1_9RHOB|nr:ABC transporter substrate-binding protein [Tranquillimonas alkanivorans]SFP18265.1 peptide/nickel transport system substrate-binding protein [Tranquillimonas alkanivorans]
MKKLLYAGIAGIALSATGAIAQVDQDAPTGGSMIVTYKDDVATLDPAIGYDWQNWSMIKSLFDGLMGYEPGTTTLRLELADSHDISDDGLVHTFTLKDGIKFHNGREITAEDVKYSLERVTNPETRSPGAGFFGMIEGFEDWNAGEGEGLSGVKVIDDKTVEITLNRPDATFGHVMALNFASVVPQEAVEASGEDFGREPVGSGAYKLADWTPGQQVVFERFEDYHRAGVPKLDQITFEIGLEPTVALLRMQQGQADIPGDGIPPAQFLQVMNDPEQADNVVEGGQLHTGYITLNTQMEPFDDKAVRQAVNMAINKDRIVRIINGRAVPANQPLPPTMPGYAEDYEGYAFDPEKAKQMLADAGYPDGFSTELYVMNVDPNPRIAQAIQQDLSAIGIDAEIRNLAQANVIAAGGEPDQAPMIWSGGMAWIADFPDPSNFYGPILGCGGAVQGGWNWAWYCNEELDARAAEADSMTDPDQAEARIDAWRQIYLDVMEDAPWVPVFNEQRFTYTSDRLAGDDSLFVDPVHIPVNYDYVYSTEAQ